MIVDTSAVIAILRREPGFDVYRQALGRTDRARISAATSVEVGIVAGPRRQAEIDDLLGEGEIEVVPFDHAQAQAARAAYLRYGRRSGSRARLNFGDCFSYALAQVTGEPLLFKGDDFTHTDVTPAI